jgi:hypothetical protein
VCWVTLGLGGLWGSVLLHPRGHFSNFTRSDFANGCDVASGFFKSVKLGLSFVLMSVLQTEVSAPFGFASLRLTAPLESHALLVPGQQLFESIAAHSRRTESPPIFASADPSEVENCSSSLRGGRCGGCAAVLKFKSHPLLLRVPNGSSADVSLVEGPRELGLACRVSLWAAATRCTQFLSSAPPTRQLLPRALLLCFYLKGQSLR